jgi:hypothetical protein
MGGLVKVQSRGFRRLYCARVSDERAATRIRRRLGFLGGYQDDAGLWVAPPYLTAEALDAGELARVERSLGGLPEREAASVARALAAIRAGLPPTLSREAAKAAESVEPRLVETARWVTAAAPKDLVPMLHWLAAERESLARLSTALVMRLWVFRRECRESAPFLADVLDVRLASRPLDGGAARLRAVAAAIRQLAAGTAVTEPPALGPPAHALLVEWTQTLGAMPPRVRRDAFRLYPLAAVAPSSARQTEAWRGVDEVDRVLRKRTPPRTPAEQAGLEAMAVEALARATAWPVAVDLEAVLGAIGMAAHRRGTTEAIVRAVARLPAPSGLEPAWLEHLCRATAHAWDRVLPLLEAIPAAGTAAERWRAMQILFHDVLPRSRVALTRAGDAPPRAAWTAALALARRDEPLGDARERLALAFEITRDPELAEELVRAIAFTTMTTRTALLSLMRLLPGGGDAKAIAERVQKLEDEADLLSGIVAFADRRRTGDARALVLAGHGKALAAAGRLAGALDPKVARRLIPSLAGPRRLPAWVERFPASLHAALGQLSVAAGDEAEAIAARHLRELVPKGDRPARAITAVRAQHLAAKVDAAAQRETLGRWHAALEQEVRRQLGAKLGVRELPEAWLDGHPNRLGCFVQAAKLPADSLTMARRVLSRRLGPPPWDLREDGHNAAFLARLGARGIDVRPWLDGIPPSRAAGEHGPVTLAFEADPLELLEMGEHFGTCLSPTGCNYFSVFANLLDVNKRVVYARDGAGKVVGRCLVGLTEVGGIVTFHPYCHGDWAFAAAVRELLEEVAHRMGTVLLASGDVPRLGAHDWYDDGTEDLTGRLGAFAAGSPLRNGMVLVEPGALRGFLERELGALGLALDELTFPLVVGLDEAKRIALGPAFAEIAEGLETLPLVTLEAITRLGRGLAVFPEVIARLGPRLLAAAVRAGDQAPDDLVEIAAAHPSATLAFLRSTQRGGVRRLEDEHAGLRVAAIAEALHALKRPRQAADHFRRLLDAKPAQNLANLARERLAVISGC